jgi:hypothetical protein
MFKTIFLIFVFLFTTSNIFAAEINLKLGDQLEISGNTVTCGQATAGKCEYIAGNVYCGYGCEYIAGNVYCSNSASEKCEYIAGNVYCGLGCKYLAGNIYCVSGGKASPAKPAKP